MASTHVGGPLRVGDATGKGSAKGSLGVSTSAYNAYKIAPVALSATAVAAAQAVAGAANLTINGASAASGVATLDVPRAVSVVSSNAGDTTQVATVTGTDAYGVTTVEAITFNGTTTVNGKKAFKTITRVAVSAAMTGNASVGSTDIFGIPFRVDNRGAFSSITWNSAAITTGTFTAAVTTSPATATTGDVRGTFLVPDASNGTKILYLHALIEDFDTNNGLYGVDQFGG